MNEQKTDAQVDYDKLAEFMKKVTPGILEALDEAYATRAFDDYSPNVTETSSATVKLLKKISIPKEADTQVRLFEIKQNNIVCEIEWLSRVECFVD